MKFVLALCAAVALTCSVGRAGPQPGHTLYYLNESHNVRALTLDPDGHPVGESRPLTSLGNYDDYSVSPNDDYVVGFRRIGVVKDEDVDLTFVTWKCYLESTGAKSPASVLRVTRYVGHAAHEPIWSRNGSYVVFIYGLFDVEGGAVYSTTSTRKVGRFSAWLGPLSRDERLAVIGLEGDHGTELWVLDIPTGHKVRIEDGVGDCVWIRNSHKLAWIRDFDNVWTAEVKRTSTAPFLNSRARLFSGNCTDLRYVPEKGLYFVDGPKDSGTPYYSRDIKTVRTGDRQPNLYVPQGAYERVKSADRAWLQYAQYSPGRDFVACPVDMGPGKMPQIRIYDRAGNSWAAATGKAPRWKGSQQIWTSWTSPF